MIPRKILAFSLSALMAAMLLAGCSGDPKTSTPTDTKGTTGTQVTEAEATGATEETGSVTESTSNETGATDKTNSQKTNAPKTNSQKTKAPTKAPTKSNSGKFDVSKAPMPTRNVSNKKLQFYSWGDVKTTFGNKPKSLANLFKKETGITLESVQKSYDQYWEQLNTLKAAGKSPDIVDLPNWKFYPQPIVEDLIQPLDSFIDFSNPMWDDTKDMREKNKWNGKVYVPFQSEYLDTWLFFNKKMFKDAGLKDPQYYWEKDDWTYDRFSELANAVVIKDKATKEVTQWGFVQQTSDLIATTGLELFSGDGKGGYVNNLKDPKVAKLMNMLYDMGAGGTGCYYTGDQRTGFKSGKVAMIATQIYSATVEFNDLRLAGNLGWVPMPKQDKNSKYYHQTATDPGYGITVGAKNVEGAALFIEYAKWFDLGYNFCNLIPRASKNAADIKYAQYEEKPEPNKMLTSAEIAYTQKILDKHYGNVSQMWQSWITDGLPGMSQVLSGEMKWSAAVEKKFPEVEAILKAYCA